MFREGLNLIKDIVISILILACIVLRLIVIFYDKLPITKSISEPDHYTLSQKMQQELGDTSIDSTEEIVVNYNINAKDLKEYEENNEYNKGKSDPFGGVIKIDNNTEDNDDSSSTTNNSSGFYEDDGTK